MIGAIGPRLEILGQRSGPSSWGFGVKIEGSRVKSQGSGAMISAITMTFLMVLYARTYR